MGLLVGFVIAYAMNWWLVANHLKHGMMTVRPASAIGGVPAHDTHAPGPEAHGAHSSMRGAPNGELSMSMIESAPRPQVAVMVVLSFLALAVGVMIAFL